MTVLGVRSERLFQDFGIQAPENPGEYTPRLLLHQRTCTWSLPTGGGPLPRAGGLQKVQGSHDPRGRARSLDSSSRPPVYDTWIHVWVCRELRVSRGSPIPSSGGSLTGTIPVPQFPTVINVLACSPHFWQQIFKNVRDLQKCEDLMQGTALCHKLESSFEVPVYDLQFLWCVNWRPGTGI